MILTLAIGATTAYQWTRCRCIHWRQLNTCRRQSDGIHERFVTGKGAARDVIRLCATKGFRGKCWNGPPVITHGFASSVHRCALSMARLISTKTRGRRVSARTNIDSSTAISCHFSISEVMKTPTKTTKQKTRPRISPGP